MSLGAEVGKLCVSVIEARNVQADTSSGLNFYVKLRVGLSQAKTDVATNTASPKFLKDLRLSVVNPSTDTLLVELMQQGQRGDLVIGKESLRVASVMDQGTLVTWLPLPSMDGDCAAELCLVMRYLQANSNRPMTPSYNIAAREAKQRALDGNPSEPGMIIGAGASAIIKTGVSKSLFSDLPGSPTLAPSTPAKEATAASALAPASASPITPAGSPAAVSSPADIASASSIYGTPTRHASGSGTANASASPRASGSGSPAVAIVTGGLQGSTQQAAKLSRRRRGMGFLRGLGRAVKGHAGKVQLPMPLVVAVGSMLGAFLYMAKLRPILEGPDVDAPCAVGACFRQDVYDRYRQRYSTF